MIPGIADRMQAIRPFYVMDLLARARSLEAAGRSIVHMEIGEPDFVTPDPIIQAAHRALDEGRTHYTPALGLPELRQALSAHYRDAYGCQVPPERIGVTPGSSGALQLALSVAVNPGEQVLMADPGYPCNRNFVRLVGGIPIGVPVGPDTSYQLSAALVEAAWTPQTRAVMVASPANPTGTLLPTEELQALYRLVSERGGMLIVDEIYHGLVYESSPKTALAVADDLFVITDCQDKLFEKLLTGISHDKGYYVTVAVRRMQSANWNGFANW